MLPDQVLNSRKVTVLCLSMCEASGDFSRACMCRSAICRTGQASFCTAGRPVARTAEVRRALTCGTERIDEIKPERRARGCSGARLACRGQRERRDAGEQEGEVRMWSERREGEKEPGGSEIKFEGQTFD